MSPTEILEFWFADGMERHWFRPTDALDREIRDQFSGAWQKASEGAIDEWSSSPEGSLALVILLDQLPLNMFRGERRAFATEQQAVTVTLAAIDRGHDKSLAGPKRAFLYMPLMHSEDLRHQDLSVDLYSAAGLKDNERFARHHRELIRRFGRFPHRNEILGRESTPEERDYLSSKEAFTG